MDTPPFRFKVTSTVEGKTLDFYVESEESGYDAIELFELEDATVVDLLPEVKANGLSTPA